MAPNNQNIQIGPAKVEISDWVTGGGAGTFTELGHTRNPTTIVPAYENVDLETEQSYGIVDTAPAKDEYAVNFSALELTPDNVRRFLSQAAGNLAAGVLRIGDRNPNAYYQIRLTVDQKLATPYTSLVVLLWRVQINQLAELAFAKRDWTMATPTGRVLRDDTVVTADKYMRFSWS